MLGGKEQSKNPVRDFLTNEVSDLHNVLITLLKVCKTIVF